jgi:CRP/FNR family transcriptional regulator, cyclic AMP receptor protein
VAVDTRVEYLRGSDLFHELDEDALERIAADATEYECPADTVLIEPRVPASGIFVIVEGTVAAETHDGRRHELGPGQSVGELSILANTVRTGRVWAKTPVRCLAFDRNEFERLLESEPAVARALLRVLACRLVEAQAHR